MSPAGRLLPLSAFYGLALTVAWWAALSTPDRVWWAFLIKSTPPGLYLAPAIALAALAWRARARGALALHAAALPLALWGLLGWQLPLGAGRPPTEPGEGASGSGGERLRVITWNCFEGQGLSGQAARLGRLRPDLLLVQEAVPPGGGVGALEEAARALGMTATLSSQGDLATLTREPPLEVEEIPLSPGNSALAVRLPGLTAVNLHLSFTNVAVFLGAGLGAPDYLEQRARLREAELFALRAALERLPPPLFLAGDFNTPPTSDLHARLRGRLRDSFAEVGAGFGWTFPAWLPALRIDYVYLSPGLEVAEAQVLPLGGSDHLPLRVDLFAPPHGGQEPAATRGRGSRADRRVWLHRPGSPGGPP